MGPPALFYGLVVAPDAVVPVAPAAAAPEPLVPAAAVLAVAGATCPIERPNELAAGLPLPADVETAPKPAPAPCAPVEPVLTETPPAEA